MKNFDYKKHLPATAESRVLGIEENGCQATLSALVTLEGIEKLFRFRYWVLPTHGNGHDIRLSSFSVNL